MVKSTTRKKKSSSSLKPERVYIYCDGSCLGGTDHGGWGVVLFKPKTGTYREISGYEVHTTSPKMELMAVLEGLRALTRTYRVTIYTNSRTVCEGITKRWRRGTHRKLWTEIANRVTFQNVTCRWASTKKGSSGGPHMARARELARDGQAECLLYV